MKTAYLLAALGLILVSCAGTGTHQSVLNKEALDSVHTIGIAPYLMNDAATAVYDSVFQALDTTLVGHLRASGRFTRIVPWDTLKLYVDEHARPVPPQLFERAKQDHIDAVLFCKLEMLKSSYMFIPLNDAAVTLVLSKADNKAMILSLQFSTKQGASYFLPPGVGQVTKDATAGAVEALLKAAKISS